MNSEREFLAERYARLWHGAIEGVRSGAVKIDPQLAGHQPDGRRGLTVLARPSEPVRRAVEAFLNALRVVEPGQYYYDRSEFHITILSLFTATVEHERNLAHFEKYREAVRAALSPAPQFALEFTGITLTPEAVMIQGYFRDSILNDTRNALRGELRARQLTDGLDARYVLQTAHMTVVRFQKPLENGQRFAELLEGFRQHSFGEMLVPELHLVRNDWYMSRASVEVLERYQLSSSSTPQVAPAA